jgi:hypothetical protein
MSFSTPRHLLSLAIAGVGITNIFAQVSQPLAPGSRVQVEHCQRIEMEVIPSGRLQVIATPFSEAKVMGYTDTPIPADAPIPSNMQYWLECVEQGAAYVAEHPETQLGSNSAQRATSNVIRPLLGRIEWDQADPYNRLCPPGTPVGCVATAMAQVMLYWKHPNQGTGSHTWTWEGTTHTVNFDSVTYNWDLMLPKYGRAAHPSPEQEAEAAKLSYHCGVSIDMMWQSGGSGTYTEHIPKALRDHFDYNERAATVYRESYSFDGWNELLISELEAGRPIIFSASSDEAGHAFVIDGIDKDGLFHVNWGWDGWYNGYFDINILNPYGAGIGATETEVGFCMGQNAVIQVCPDKGVGRLYSKAKSSGAWLNSNENAYVLSAYFENTSYDTLRGVSGVEVLNDLGQHVRYEMGDTITIYPYGTWDRRHNRYYYAWTNTYGYAQGLADGDYSAQLCFEQFGADTMICEVPTHYYYTPKIEFSVKDELITAITSCSGTNIIEGRNFSLQGQELAVGKEYIATIDLVNFGNDPFSGAISLEIITPDGKETDIPDCDCPDLHVFIPAGETYTAKIPFMITQEGEWRARLLAYNIPMGYEMTDCPTDIPIAFSTKFTEESPASLLLVEAPQLLTERCEVDGEIEFQLVVSNAGGKFSDRMGLRFYTGQSTNVQPAFTIDNDVEIAMSAQSDTITISGTLTEAKGMKKYYARPYYRDAYGDEQLLKLSDSTGSSSIPAAIEVRVYNASGIETITIDDAPVIRRYDLFGRPVQEGKGRITISPSQKAFRK